MPDLSPASIAFELMGHDSTTGREGAVVAFTDALLREWGWETTLVPVEPGRECVLARMGEDPVVTLSTHLDTVPPYIPPWLEEGVLYGRGSCDAKGIAASMMVAASRLRAQGMPVAMLFVIGEETNHAGARAANEWITTHMPVRPRALINGEPTGSTLGVGTKGALRVNVRVHGRACHSAYPELGESATSKLVHMLAELDGLTLPSDPVLGATTINIGSISGGVADNVIAPRADARLMARVVTSVDEVWALLNTWAAGRAELERGVEVPPVRLTTFEGFPTSVAAFATDIPALTNWGKPYLFGPGSIHLAHTPHEHVQVEELDRAVASYVALAERAVDAIAAGAQRG